MRLPSSIIVVAALACGVSGASALELKDVTFNTNGGGKVVFSHKVHLKKRSEKTADVSCKSCHDSGGSGKPRVVYTMADMERGKSCGKCHNGGQAFALGRCTGCHKVQEITFQVKETGPVRFSHARHLRSMQCDACHNKIYRLGSNRHVSMAAMEKGKSCGACHDGKEAFAVARCQKCHPVKEIDFRLAGIADAKFSHSAHLKTYRCGSCHTGTFPARTGNRPVTMSEMYQAKSCGACHDGKKAFTVHGNCESCHLRG